MIQPFSRVALEALEAQRDSTQAREDRYSLEPLESVFAITPD